jgi:hypothetical protein
MNDLQSIWGSSPSDVWTVGPGGSYDSRLFHYDGSKWDRWTVICKGRTLFGFSKNNVWMAGDEGEIWHFDGAAWKQSFVYSPTNAYSVYISNIWGTAPNNVYAVGGIFYDSQNTQRGFILHYDGKKWQELFKAGFYSQFQRIRKENENIYIQAIKLGYSVSDTTEFYQFTGNKLTRIFSEANDKIYTANLNLIGDKVYFVIGHDVYRYEAGFLGIKKFVKIFSFNNPNFGYQVYGRNEKDVFVRMFNGIAHFDGTDLVYMHTFDNNFTSINNIPAIFENEVFFCVADYVNKVNFVLSGKLK